MDETASIAADVELLQRIAAGDSAALGTFYDSHCNTLFALAYRIVSDHKEAEDVIQEVLLQVWDKAVTYDPQQGRPLAWVITLTRNKAIDRRRSAMRRIQLMDAAESEAAVEIPGTTGSASEAAELGDEAGLIRAALAELPEDQRRAIELAFFTGLSQTEIATQLNEPLGTIKARIRRGMLKLREVLEAQL